MKTWTNWVLFEFRHWVTWMSCLRESNLSSCLQSVATGVPANFSFRTKNPSKCRHAGLVVSRFVAEPSGWNPQPLGCCGCRPGVAILRFHASVFCPLSTWLLNLWMYLTAWEVFWGRSSSAVSNWCLNGRCGAWFMGYEAWGGLAARYTSNKLQKDSSDRGTFPNFRSPLRVRRSRELQGLMMITLRTLELPQIS